MPLERKKTIGEAAAANYAEEIGLEGVAESGVVGIRHCPAIAAIDRRIGGEGMMDQGATAVGFDPEGRFIITKLETDLATQRQCVAIDDNLLITRSALGAHNPGFDTSRGLQLPTVNAARERVLR